MAPDIAAAAPDLHLHLHRSGLTLTVPHGESLLDAIEEAGVEVDWMCRAGICGTCELRVLDGVPLHRDRCLSDSQRTAGDVITPCVSWASSPTLVLDV